MTPLGAIIESRPLLCKIWINSLALHRRALVFMKKTQLLKIVLVLAAVSALHTAAMITRLAVYPDLAHRIPPGVTVEGIPVGGLSEQAALMRLGTNRKFKVPGMLKFSAAGRNFDLDFAELSYEIKIEEAVSRAAAVGSMEPFGRRLRTRYRVYATGIDVRVRCTWDPKALDGLLALTSSKIDRQPVNAAMNWDTKTWTTHRHGQALDTVKARAFMAHALQLYNGRRFALPVRTLLAKITADKFKNIDFDKPLGSFETKYSEGKINRSKNLRRVADILTGYEIEPGKTFSYNEVVGERNRENGFFLAPVIANGRFKDDWGGGACQPSTTLFNAALFAGLQDFEWSPHSQVSGYADPGRDAAVAFGQIDLKFTNPHKQSVFVFATATKGVFSVSLFSEFKPDYTVELRSEWWGRFWPGEKVIKVNTLEPGKRVVISRGASGMSAALYRKFIYKNGKTREERMANKGGDVLRYPGAKRIVHEGPPEPET